MIITTIDGTQKEKPECKVCKGGDIFKDEEFTYSDDLSPLVRQRICQACNTKYLLKAYVKLDENLTPKNASMLTRLIARDMYYEETRMNPTELNLLRNLYEQTGVCNHPKEYEMESKPFRTPEGTFTIKSCHICKKATLNYNGKTYTDTIEKLINFIATQGQYKELPTIKFLGQQKQTAVTDKKIIFIGTNTISF